MAEDTATKGISLIALLLFVAIKIPNLEKSERARVNLQKLLSMKVR